MKLVQFDNWYHDEMRVQGFSVMTDTEYTNMLNTISEVSHLMRTDGIPYIELYFGLNECFEVDDMNEFLDCFETTDISEQQAEILTYFFGREYGYWPVSALEDWLHDTIIERDMN